MKAISGKIFIVSLVTLLACALVYPLWAQAPAGPQGGQPQQSAPPTPPPAAQNPASKPPTQAPPEAGVTIAVDVPVVTLDVIATTKNGDILTGLKKENFRVLDDGAPQTITNFAPTDAPITMVVLMEFSGRAYGLLAAYAKFWSDALFPNLQQKDWVALETFDMKTRLEVDFTQDKNEVRGAISRLSPAPSAGGHLGLDRFRLGMSACLARGAPAAASSDR